MTETSYVYRIVRNKFGGCGVVYSFCINGRVDHSESLTPEDLSYYQCLEYITACSAKLLSRKQ